MIVLKLWTWIKVLMIGEDRRLERIRRYITLSILAVILIGTSVYWVIGKLKIWFPPPPDESLKMYAYKIERAVEPPLLDVIYMEIVQDGQVLVIYQSIERADAGPKDIEIQYMAIREVVKELRKLNPKLVQVVVFLVEGRNEVYAVTSVWVYDAELFAEVGVPQANTSRKTMNGVKMDKNKILWAGQG